MNQFRPILSLLALGALACGVAIWVTGGLTALSAAGMVLGVVVLAWQARNLRAAWAAWKQRGAGESQ